MADLREQHELRDDIARALLRLETEEKGRKMLCYQIWGAVNQIIYRYEMGMDKPSQDLPEGYFGGAHMARS